MQKIKKTLAVFIAVLMVALSFPITSFALTSGDFEFTLTGEGGALITGYSSAAVNVDIPAVLTTSDGNKYEVQSVNMDIFDSVNIEKISVPKTVRAMENIFRLNRYHTSLARIDVDDGNENYSSQDGVLFNKEASILYCYPNARSATVYSIPSSVENIFTCAFYGAINLRGTTKGNSVTSIGEYAFAECSNLAAVQLGSKLTRIGDSAFNGCKSLVVLNIPQSVSSIGIAAFRNCESLTAFTVNSANENYAAENGVLFSLSENKNKTQLIAYPAAKNDKSYKIPDSVIVCASYSFFGAKKLESVSMGSSLLDIRSYAFSDCEVLNSVTLGATVSNIGECAFLNCAALLNIKIGRNVNSIGNHALGYYYIPATSEYRLYENFSITTPANTAAYQYAYNNHITLITEGECAHTYSYVTNIVSPTCTKPGYTEYACTYCGAHFIRTPVEPLGHSESEWIVDREPTYERTGMRHKVCDRCKQITVTEVIPMLKTSIANCRITLSSNSVTATGKEIEPKVRAAYEGQTLIYGVDYKVSYKNNINPGVATAVVTGIGSRFDSTKEITFKIKPKKVKGFKVSKKSATSLTLKWNTQKKITGYKIYMLNTKTEKYQLVKTIRGASKNKVTVSRTPTGARLKNKKTYKFKICAYKVASSSATVYSDKVLLVRVK